MVGIGSGLFLEKISISIRDNAIAADCYGSVRDITRVWVAIILQSLAHGAQKMWTLALYMRNLWWWWGKVPIYIHPSVVQKVPTHILQIWWQLCNSLMERKKTYWIYVPIKWKLKPSQIKGKTQVSDKRMLKSSDRVYVILCRSMISTLSKSTLSRCAVCTNYILAKKGRWNKCL